MKFKNLLNLALVMSAGISAQAQTQIFKEDFSAAQSKAETDLGWYEFINTQEGDDRTVADGVCKFVNTEAVACENQGWQRAIKFRNLKLEEGKVYRLSFECWAESQTWGEGKNNLVRSGLLQGGENCDIAIMTAKKDEGQQYISWSPVSTDANNKYSSYIYFHSSQNQYDAYNARTNKTKDLEETYFAAINIINPGTYSLDNVVLEEIGKINEICPVKSAVYGSSVIAVDFLYGTNIADLVAKSENGVVILPEGAVKLNVNGKDVDIMAAELHADGKLYIFRDEDDDVKSMKISFTNSADEALQVCWKGDAEGAIASFSDVEVVYSEDFEVEESNILPWAYSAPIVKSTTPINESFAHEGNITEFTFKFDKAVSTVNSFATEYVEGVAPTAKLVGPGVNEELKLKEGTPEDTETVTFVRTGSNALTKGQYTVTFSNVCSTVGTPTDYAPEILFEVGKVQLAETIYTDLFTTLLKGGNGGQPENWSILVGGADWNGGNPKDDNGSACRNLNVTGQDGVEYTAFYLCDRDGYTYMKYGDKEGAALTVPAGNIEFTLIGLSHDEGGHTLSYRIEDMDGNEVASASGACAVVANNAFTTLAASDHISVRFNNPTERNLILKVREPQGGFTACRVLGFNVKSYVETEGDKMDTEVLAKGDFVSAGNDKMPAHGTGWKIYRNDNRLRDPGTSGAWGGSPACWTGGGGPRVKNLGNKGLAGAGIYLAGGCYATYGEYDVQTDHNGEVKNEAGETTPEQTLDIKAGRYQISYGIIGWKNPDSKYYISLDIYKQSEGISGEPVYSRKDEVSGNTRGGGDGTDDAKKIQFFWTAPTADKYILKFTASGDGEGEAVVGNVLFETTSSLAVQYASMLEKALVPAKEELALANENDNYRGATREALDAAITNYANPDFHVADEYNSAVADIDKLIKQSKARRSNVDAYPNNLKAISEGLEAAKGTKHEALPQYPIVVEAYNTYKDVDYVALNDEDLIAANTVMGNNGNLLKNMVNTCVPLLTKQITDLAKAIVDLDAEAENQAYVLAAGNVITDDQELVANLKKLYASKLYGKIAAGQNPFVEYDAELELESPITIPASFLIQNPSFYCTTIVEKDNVNVPADAFPGWSAEVLQGSMSSAYNTTNWGGAYPTVVKPVENCSARTGWGTAEYTIQQLINNLPVAKYTAVIKIGEDGSEHKSYAFVKYGEEEKQAAYEGNDGNYSRDHNSEANTKTFEDITPDVAGNLGSLTLGAYMFVAGGFANVDDASITMTGKVDGFDYAAAAKALNDDIALSVEDVKTQAVGEPVNVAYYDLTGKAVANPAGVTIKVATYANGYVVVSKEIKK